MNILQHITLSALLAGASLSFAHEPPQQHQHAAAPVQQAWGVAGEAKAVTRTITVTMHDNMRFTPSHLDVKLGETVRLRVRNAGKMQHELVLGNPQELAEHAALMQQHPDMEHDEAHMVHVAPGKTGNMIWAFNRAGDFEFACLIAGHYQAGMKGTVRVLPAKGSATTPATTPAAAPQAAGHAHEGMHHHMQSGMHAAGMAHAMPSMHHGMHNGMQPGMAQGAPHSIPNSSQPYAGQQQREIKALSDEELQAYREGRGFGFAKAAELNGYPGPMHTLELATELDLSEAQRAKTQALLTQHKAEVRQIGAELIEAERALDQAFASRSVDETSLRALITTAGEKLAQLRAAHLQTHLAQTAMLTPSQIERYKALRGYGSSAMAMKQQPMQHGHMAQ